MAIALTGSVQTFLNTTSSTALWTSAAFTPAVGDVLVITSTDELAGVRSGVTVDSSPALVWTQRAVNTTSLQCYATVYTATVLSAVSTTVNVHRAGQGATSDNWTACLAMFSGVTGFGVSTTQTISGANPSGSIAGVTSGSALVWCMGDFNAIASPSRVYRTSGVEEYYDQNAKLATYHAHQLGSGAGTITYGMSTAGSSSSSFDTAVVELLGAATVVYPQRIRMVRQQAVARASFT